MPRLVIPGYPHHVTQRGARRMKTFFSDDDYFYYLDLVSRYKNQCGVDVWAYCLMPNHVHFVVVPEEEESLSRLFKEVHRRYTRYINFRERWKGHLWQERFHSFVMNEQYLLATVRYVELNPVKAKLCALAEEWAWSSAGSHILACDNDVVSVQPMLERISDWKDYLQQGERDIDRNTIRQCLSTGRPAGDEQFVQELEALTGMDLSKKKPGPKANC
jgi:putative transposase